MMVTLLVTALASFVVLATGVAADSPNHDRPHSLPITKKINTLGEYYPVKKDHRRFKHLMNQLSSSSLGEEPAKILLDNVGPSYVAKVGVGSPPAYYELIVDTGSSNTWVGANASYRYSSSSVNTTKLVNVTYGSGFFTGYLFKDDVTLAPGVSVYNQSVGVAFNSSGISPQDGILGLGPTNLTLGTIIPDNTSVTLTVTDNLFKQGQIKQNLVAVSFEPTTNVEVVNGELTFGDTDPTKYIGDIHYSPISKSRLASRFWGVDASIGYGDCNGNDLVDTGAGIVDTGTTLIYLATSAYNKYVEATGGVLDNNTDFLRVTDEQYKNLQPLNFVIGGQTFDLTPNAQRFPQALNTAINGTSDSVYLVVKELNFTGTTGGMDFICGMAFLERYYSVFDTGNRRVGLARTPFTNATIN